MSIECLLFIGLLFLLILTLVCFLLMQIRYIIFYCKNSKNNKSFLKILCNSLNKQKSFNAFLFFLPIILILTCCLLKEHIFIENYVVLKEQKCILLALLFVVLALIITFIIILCYERWQKNLNSILRRFSFVVAVLSILSLNIYNVLYDLPLAAFISVIFVLFTIIFLLTNIAFTEAYKDNNANLLAAINGDDIFESRKALCDNITGRVENTGIKYGETIIIDAPYGAGKTTALNYIIKKLKNKPDFKKNPIYVINISCLETTEIPKLLEIYLLRLKKALDDAKVFTYDYNKYICLFNYLMSVSKGAKDVQSRKFKQKEIYEIKEKLKNEINQVKILTCIDDFDRITIEQQKEFLKLFQNIREVWNQCVLFLMDYESLKAEDMEYFEKFISARFSLTEIPFTEILEYYFNKTIFSVHIDRLDTKITPRYILDICEKIEYTLVEKQKKLEEKPRSDEKLNDANRKKQIEQRQQIKNYLQTFSINRKKPRVIIHALLEINFILETIIAKINKKSEHPKEVAEYFNKVKAARTISLYCIIKYLLPEFHIKIFGDKKDEFEERLFYIIAGENWLLPNEIFKLFCSMIDSQKLISSLDDKLSSDDMEILKELRLQFNSLKDDNIVNFDKINLDDALNFFIENLQNNSIEIELYSELLLKLMTERYNNITERDISRIIDSISKKYIIHYQKVNILLDALIKLIIEKGLQKNDRDCGIAFYNFLLRFYQSMNSNICPLLPFIGKESNDFTSEYNKITNNKVSTKLSDIFPLLDQLACMFEKYEKELKKWSTESSFFCKDYYVENINQYYDAVALFLKFKKLCGIINDAFLQKCFFNTLVLDDNTVIEVYDKIEECKSRDEYEKLIPNDEMSNNWFVEWILNNINQESTHLSLESIQRLKSISRKIIELSQHLERSYSFSKAVLLIDEYKATQ